MECRRSCTGRNVRPNTSLREPSCGRRETVDNCRNHSNHLKDRMTHEDVDHHETPSVVAARHDRIVCPLALLPRKVLIALLRVDSAKTLLPFGGSRVEKIQVDADRNLHWFLANGFDQAAEV